MFIVDSLGPASSQFVLQRFRFADSAEGFCLRFLNESQNSESLAAVLLNPPGQVFQCVLV